MGSNEVSVWSVVLYVVGVYASYGSVDLLERRRNDRWGPRIESDRIHGPGSWCKGADCPRLAEDLGTAESNIGSKPRYSSESKHLNEHIAKRGRKGEEGRCIWIDRSQPIRRE